MDIRKKEDRENFFRKEEEKSSLVRKFNKEMNFPIPIIQDIIGDGISENTEDYREIISIAKDICRDLDLHISYISSCDVFFTTRAIRERRNKGLYFITFFSKDAKNEKWHILFKTLRNQLGDKIRFDLLLSADYSP